VLLDPASGDGEHLRTAVHTDDRAAAADLFEQFRDVEAGTAADVEDPLARRRRESLADKAPPPEDVARPVDRLQLIGDVLVEDQAHQGSMRGRKKIRVLPLSRRALAAFTSLRHSGWGTAAFGRLPVTIPFPCLARAISAMR
jgi:hypothetical protein